MNTPCIFALDIGTRKIAGLIMRKTPDAYEVLHTVIKEQLPSAMQDGQIHDIPKVAAVIKQVCNEIAKYTNESVTQAAVAAAGRSLLTQHGQATKELEPNQEITPLKLHEIELSALQDALNQINQHRSRTSIDTFLCVGYTAVQRYLDDQPIQNLLGHQGYSASVEIIATFLPRIVIDSLSSALRLAGLNMLSLTLEPIAAMHTVIPQSMRMLNLALVDIGAGTSDIAISADGTIKAYGMVSEAGDLITKIIADKYLLDFMEAEKVKCQLSSKSINCEDVLGNQVKIDADSVLTLIKPVVSQLAAKISSEIIALNEGPPKGVMLIGGGSLTPQITEQISKQLQLPTNLVRIRERSALKEIKGAQQHLGPQLITPICIGYHHLDGLAMQLQKVEVNNQVVQFLRMPNTTVGDALINAGYTVHDLLGTREKQFDIYVNQKHYSLTSERGESAKIYCNGEPASINTLLTGNDKIEISQQESIENQKVLLCDVIEHLKLALNLNINGKPMAVVPRLRVNQQEQPLTYPISTGDQIDYQPIETVSQALRSAGINPHNHSITVKINHQPIKLQTSSPLRVNGQPASEDHPIKNGDRIEIRQNSESAFILSDIFRVYHQLDKIKHVKQIQFTINDRVVGYTHPLKDGDQIVIHMEN